MEAKGRPPKIFISYRRADTEFPATALYERLTARFGADQVFMDVDAIPAGRNFRRHLQDAVTGCDVVLVLIGKGWLDAHDEQGQRCLDLETDWVRIELEAALARDIPVIPLLVGMIRMPQPAQLPEQLQELCYRQALPLRSGRDFGRDIESLGREVERTVAHGEPKEVAAVLPGGGLRPAREAERLTDAATATASGSKRGGSPNQLATANGLVELVLIPAGAFIMGSPEGEAGRSNDEGPQHRVTVPAFYMGRYPVTNEEYMRYLAANSMLRESSFLSYASSKGPRHPAAGVTWEEARRFATWAGSRLPTEAEWEYAARAGTAMPYLTGASEEDLSWNGWYRDNSDGELRPVGEKAANAWGLYDVLGSVWEWVEDTWHDSYEGAPTDGSAWATPPRAGQLMRGALPDAGRLMRGGSARNGAHNVRVAKRDTNVPQTRSDVLGFRLARSLSSQTL
jgi:formylglycine-generating enzyme required for sulfatase activity